eukprot:1160784-Pelagomonas_calceolata.AAC.6
MRAYTQGLCAAVERQAGPLPRQPQRQASGFQWAHTQHAPGNLNIKTMDPIMRNMAVVYAHGGGTCTWRLYMHMAVVLTNHEYVTAYKLDKVCVPQHMAVVLTYPERVTAYNLDKLKLRVLNGMCQQRISSLQLGLLNIEAPRGLRAESPGLLNGAYGMPGPLTCEQNQG